MNEAQAPFTVTAQCHQLLDEILVTTDPGKMLTLKRQLSLLVEYEQTRLAPAASVAKLTTTDNHGGQFMAAAPAALPAVLGGNPPAMVGLAGPQGQGDILERLMHAIEEVTAAANLRNQAHEGVVNAAQNVIAASERVIAHAERVANALGHPLPVIPAGDDERGPAPELGGRQAGDRPASGHE